MGLGASRAVQDGAIWRRVRMLDRRWCSSLRRKPCSEQSSKHRQPATTFLRLQEPIPFAHAPTKRHENAASNTQELAATSSGAATALPPQGGSQLEPTLSSASSGRHPRAKPSRLASATKAASWRQASVSANPPPGEGNQEEDGGKTKSDPCGSILLLPLMIPLVLVVAPIVLVGMCLGCIDPTPPKAGAAGGAAQPTSRQRSQRG